MQNANILLIGAGKMGGALLAAWLRAGVKPESITVIESDTGQAKKLSAQKVKVAASLADVAHAPHCIVLAVKPQSMDALLPSLIFPPPAGGRSGGGHAKHGTTHLSPHPNPPPKGEENSPLYLSIAAGKTLKYFEKHLGDAPVVRAMPNTPALIGKGISALIANNKVNETQKQLAEKLLRAAGEVVWLENESQMDAVTALSGSGPAYVYLFMEVLIRAGKEQGLPEPICKQLVTETFCGASELARMSSESLEQLRKNVTSPGGTTEAALQGFILNDRNLEALVRFAVAEGVKRAKELG